MQSYGAVSMFSGLLGNTMCGNTMLEPTKHIDLTRNRACRLLNVPRLFFVFVFC